MDNLENITGNLRDAYEQCEPGTMLHSDALTTARRRDASLRGGGFYTADGPLYRVHDGVVQLGMTRLPDNLVLRHIDDAYTLLVDTGNYRPDAEEAHAAFAADDTLVTDLSQLRLIGDDEEWRYVAIDPRNYEGLNRAERDLAERVYDSGDNFRLNMGMLKDADISETRIFVLNPEYVQKETKKGPLARAAWLRNFCYNSYFYAGGRNVNYYNRLRGVQVRRRASEASAGAPAGRDAPDNLAAHYDALLRDPRAAVAALNDERAAGLSRMVADYLASRTQ